MTLLLEKEKTGKSMAIKNGNEETRKVHPAVPVKIRIKGLQQTEITYMGIDPYCGEAYMSDELLKKFNFNGVPTVVSMTTMHGNNLPTKTMVINNLEIMDLDENECTLIPVVYSKADWPFNMEDSPRPSDVESCPYMQDIPFNFIDKKIGILVGLAQSHITRPLKIVEGPDEDSPYATLHKFGWTFNGVVQSRAKNNLKCFKVKIENKEEIDSTFQQFCKQDFVHNFPGNLAPSNEDLLWEKMVRDSYCKRSDGQYEVCLPFKDKNLELPNNGQQELKRLYSLRKKMIHDEKYFDEYNAFMNMMIERKFAERVPSSELNPKPGNVWYLFHFAVRHKQKNKLRVVFDASLKYKGLCLNDVLYQGPDLTNNLLGVLLRFREEKIAVMGDIEKMFYAVKVSDAHKNFLRYYWFPNGDLAKEPVE